VLGLPVVLFVTWWAASANSENFYVPPLRQILVAFADTWTPERLRADVLPSLARLGAGYLLAALIGVAARGRDRRQPAAARGAEPVLEFFRAIPPPVLVPVIMLFAGIGNGMKVIVIVSGCVWPILLNTVEGVRATDGVLSDTARAYGITGPARLRHLLLRRGVPADRRRGCGRPCPSRSS
jgi:ABC-type nitrate/sulfonate/bicarbonate transport system permease component